MGLGGLRLGLFLRLCPRASAGFLDPSKLNFEAQLVSDLAGSLSERDQAEEGKLRVLSTTRVHEHSKYYREVTWRNRNPNSGQKRGEGGTIRLRLYEIE